MSFIDNTMPAVVKWKLDAFMEAVDSFEDIFADAVHHKLYAEQNYENILLRIVDKSIITAREILTLCANGYPEGALSLSRNLYEQMIITSFFEMHKDDIDFQSYVDDFFLSYDIKRIKCLKCIPGEDVDSLNLELRTIESHTKRKTSKDYWWTGLQSFGDVVKYVTQSQCNDEIMKNLLDIQYMRYKRACISLHAGCMGNSIRIGKNSAVNIVDTSPSLFGQSTPLAYAAMSLIPLFGFAAATFKVNCQKQLGELNQLAIFYQRQEPKNIDHNM